MKRLRAVRWLPIVAVAGWLIAAGLAAAGEAPDVEQQVHHIAAELRCPVCQNLSVADSPSPLAQEMRGLIREQLRQGKTQEEVLAYFVSKYGEWVLLAPKPRGFNLLVYVVPFGGGAAGVAGVLVGIRRWVRRRRDRDEAMPEVSAADRERLQMALEAEAEDPIASAAEGEGPLAELESQRAALYAALHELEFDLKAGMISPEDYADMRRRYEAETVALLRRLDALGIGAKGAGRPARARTAAPEVVGTGIPSEEVAEETEVGTEGAAAASRRHLWMAAGAMALVAFVVVAGALLASSIQSRPEGGSITGGPLTGTASGMPPAASASAGEPGPAASGRRPLDAATLARMLQAAHAALEAGRLAEASAAYRAVLERDPRNVVAITRMGNILERQGEMELAVHLYDKALEIAPRSLHTLWDKGNLLFQRADYAGALVAWQAFFEAAAPGRDRDYIEQRMADARARLASSGPVPPPAKPQAAPPRAGR